MATTLTIPEQQPPFPLGEVLSPESQPIHQYDAELRNAARHLRLSKMRIGYYGFRMRMNDGWTGLGFASGPRGEEDYRESLEIPRSTWYKYVRVGQALHQLPLIDLERIPLTNAELLIQVNPALWHDYSWVQEAKTLKSTALAALVTSRNKSVGDEREPLATMVWKVPFLAKKAMEGMIEAIQHKYSLSSKGQALELMIADLYQDPSLLSSVNQARQLVAAVALSMKRRKVVEGEEMTWLAMAKEVLDEGYEKAVQAARQKTSGVQKGGRA